MIFNYFIGVEKGIIYKADYWYICKNNIYAHVIYIENPDLMSLRHWAFSLLSFFGAHGVEVTTNGAQGFFLTFSSEMTPSSQGTMWCLGNSCMPSPFL